MKTITLINPPSNWMISDRDLIPLGILYLASYLRVKGHKVKIIDLSGVNNYDTFINYAYIPDKRYGNIRNSDFIGISFVTPQVEEVEQIIGVVKSINPKAKLIAGGIHATALPKETLEMGFDYVVRGEGEVVIDQILKNFPKIKSYNKNLIYTAVNELPFPSWDLIDMETYISNIGVMDYLDKDKVREINMMASRGCNNHCRYCTMFKGIPRFRSVDNVIAEIKELQKLYGINRVSFCDDNFTMNGLWLYDLCKKIKHTGIKWHCLGRTDSSSNFLYKEMFESGCIGIDFGIETGSQRLLDLINKNVTVKQQENGIYSAYKAGLKVRAQLMIGLPQETDKSIKETCDFIKRSKKYVSKFGLHTFIPYPGCDIFNNPKKYSYKLNKDFSNYQTCGKKGEWNYIPIDFKDKIDEWRNKVLKVIGNKNIQK